ncbi:MAG: septum formation initiator family protein [Acidimicrobiales bacterium]|nr:septum formation initiator family protein [Acidimicrobiales bacterium]
MRRFRRLAWPLVAVVVIVGALSLSAFPLRTLFDQRDAIASSEAELAELDEQVTALQARVEALDTPGEIERLARERYNMVRPGEEPYGILPAALPPLEVPPGWPFTPAPPATD